MIIDTHIHMYPPEAMADPVGWARRMDEPYWGALVGDNPSGKTIQGWATVDQLIRDMDAAGIDRVVIQGIYFRHHETCVVQNDWTIRYCRQYPDRLTGFATVQPLAGQQALDEVKRAVDSGLRGIGEILPYAQGHSMRDEPFLAVVELALELDIPVCLHGAEPVGHDYPGRAVTPLQDYVWLAEQYPDLKLILAHLGGLLPFYELNRTVRKIMRNVYYDTAAIPLLYRPEVYRLAVEAVGAEKILFGSDYPLLLYPRRTRTPGFADLLAEVRSAGLPADQLRRVLGENAQNLLKL
ncbi:MAG: amidohydrolase [Chloroflexi bacterium]|nr:MAG: amidohydrolase [Chloroflexota bacterium]